MLWGSVPHFCPLRWVEAEMIWRLVGRSSCEEREAFPGLSQKDTVSHFTQELKTSALSVATLLGWRR